MSHTADGLGGSPRNGSGPCFYETPPAPSLAEETSTQPQSSKASIIGSTNAEAIPDRHLRERPVLPSFGSSAGLHLDISAPRSVTDLRSDPVAQHNAHFLLQALRGLPLMATRQEMLPWFIHPSFFGTSRVPETMANCVRISKLYLERQSHQRKDSLWPVVDVENKRFLRQLHDDSREELLLGKQVQILYTVMCTLDNMSELGIPEIRLQMLMTFELYCKRLQYMDEQLSLADGSFGDLEETWRDWVYIESERRQNRYSMVPSEQGRRSEIWSPMQKRESLPRNGPASPGSTLECTDTR
ncbi:hypothetical protein DL765_003142 [Monosporascus sp. GIB2]|nr:hypothetical protein DL765_003142 [Monosporascus sp. GIB2]